MSLPSSSTKDVKHKISRSNNNQKGYGTASETVSKRSKVLAAHSADLSKMEDFVLFPEGMIAMHRSIDKGNEAYALRERQLPKGSPSQQAAVQQAETAQLQPRSRDQMRSRHRRNAENVTTYHGGDERWRGEELPAAPMPPRLNTPELEEPVGEFWPHYLLLEKQAESYIAMRKSQQDTHFYAKEGKEIMCCNDASARNGSQRNGLRQTKDRR